MNSQNRKKSKDPFKGRTKGDTGEEKGSFLEIVKSALFALPVTLVIGAILLVITALIAYSSNDPDPILDPLSVSVLMLTAVLGGFVASRRCGHAAVVCGAVSGVLFATVLFVVSLCFGDETREALTPEVSRFASFCLKAAVVALEVLGAVIAQVLMQKRAARTTSRRKSYR